MLDILQREVRVWADSNFGLETPSYRPLLGAVEEMGELSHAHLKSEQGIRGTREEHRAAKIDAVGDIVIYLADYCGREGISFSEAVQETWTKVSRRNWKENKVDGVVAVAATPKQSHKKFNVINEDEDER